MTEQQQIDLLVFQRFITHLQVNPNIQNIDLMNNIGFCRNCLSKWMVQAAEHLEMELSPEKAKERVYGMPYEEWKEKNQTPSTLEQQLRFRHPSSS